MKIADFNMKGGVGKTTISLNLAHQCAKEGRTLLVDLDPQGSALAWAALSDETLFTVGRSLSGGFDHVVYDMAPAMPTKLPDADLFIVPTLLDAASYVVFMRSMALLRSHGRKTLPVAMRVNTKRAEHRERLKDDLLQGCVIIPERAALASCYGMGLTVFDMKHPHAEKARFDMKTLFERVKEECK